MPSIIGERGIEAVDEELDVRCRRSSMVGQGAQLILIFRQKKSIGLTKEQDLHDIFSTVGGYSRLHS
jgi:hypothetical protein